MFKGNPNQFLHWSEESSNRTLRKEQPTELVSYTVPFMEGSLQHPFGRPDRPDRPVASRRVPACFTRDGVRFTCSALRWFRPSACEGGGGTMRCGGWVQNQRMHGIWCQKECFEAFVGAVMVLYSFKLESCKGQQKPPGRLDFHSFFVRNR